MIKVLPRKNALDFLLSHKNLEDLKVNLILISNTQKFDELNDSNKIIQLLFDDIEKDKDYEYVGITKEDSNKIAQFVLDHKDQDFIVSCNAGRSRSPGVAAAISKFLTGDDSMFFKDPYVPNMRCYRYVYNSLQELSK